MPGRTILFVEDNQDYQELIRLAFESCEIEHNLVMVQSAIEALDYLLGNSRYSERNLEDLPALIILDLNLPLINGPEVLQSIRANPLTRFLPVVVMSSSSESEDIRTSYLFGCNSYIPKPLDFTQLQNFAREIILYWLNINQIPPVFGVVDE
ncbi:MAG: response regulator [Xenococcaceae cyanobacterium]